MKTDQASILIRVRGRRATPVHTTDIATGNALSYKVRFDIGPDDRVWADKSLSAAFRAVTHKGAQTNGKAKVSLDGTAEIPANVLREPAKSLYVGLHGTSPGHKDADTNMAALGPVQRGAGGNGYFPPDRALCHDDRREWSWERIYHMTLAALGEYEPTVRRLLRLSHQHENLPALANIGEADGLPTWDGEAWPGGGTPDASAPLAPFLATLTPALDSALGADHPLITTNNEQEASS